MKKREVFYSILEYILAAMFIRGGIRVLFFDVSPVALPGILTYLAGAEAIYVYGFLFMLTGLLLLYAKFFKKKKLHKVMLAIMYLTCIYVLVLSIIAHGIVVGQLLTIAVGITAAALWVRWKLKTEYVDPKEFADDIEQLFKDKH